MGLLKKLLGVPQVTVTTELRPGTYQPSEPRACDVLLREATEHKKIGNWPAAIQCLRRAYADIGTGSIIYPIETYLRLPMYLFESGQKEEAWQEFHSLLRLTLSHKETALRYFDLAAVLDKMRLCMQRNKQPAQAIKFGVTSYLCHSLARYHQSKQYASDPYISKRFQEYTTDEAIKSAVRTLVHKAKMDDRADCIEGFIRAELATFPADLDIGQLATRVERLLAP